MTPTDPGKPLFQEQQRHWRRSLLVGAALIGLYYPLDLLGPGPGGAVAAAWRTAWIVVLLLAAALQRPGWERLGLLASWLAGLVSGIAAAGVVWGGGSAGPRFGFLLALPLAILLILPHQPSVALLAAAGCMGGGFLIIAHDGRDAWFALEWGVLSTALLLLAVVGAVGFRRIWVSEVEAQLARREAQEHLAVSERQRARAERLAVAGRLAAGVAHEINNPLSFVKANVHFVSQSLVQPSPEVAEALDEAKEGIQRMAQIVGDLRGLAREPLEGSEVIEVEDAFAEAWRLASTRLRSVHASWEAHPDLPPVRGERRQLVQALVNLLANAVEAAEAFPDPGRRWVRADIQADGREVRVTVEDGGAGLTPEVLEHLFEPFFSTKGAQGTGLGLALVREQVARCGGSVEGGNAPQGGARFVVRLKAAA